MNVKVHLPPGMSALVNGCREIDLEATTVGEAIDALCRRYDPLQQRLLKPNGEPRPSIRFFVNHTPPAADVRTPLKEGDVLVIAQAVAGG